MKNKELRTLVKIITKNIGLFEERERPRSHVPIKIEKSLSTERSPEVVVLDHKEETACELREKLANHKVDETGYEEVEVSEDEEVEEEEDQSGEEEEEEVEVEEDQSGEEEEEDEADQSGEEEEEVEEEEEEEEVEVEE